MKRLAFPVPKVTESYSKLIIAWEKAKEIITTSVSLLTNRIFVMFYLTLSATCSIIRQSASSCEHGPRSVLHLLLLKTALEWCVVINVLSLFSNSLTCSTRRACSLPRFSFTHRNFCQLGILVVDLTLFLVLVSFVNLTSLTQLFFGSSNNVNQPDRETWFNFLPNSPVSLTIYCQNVESLVGGIRHNRTQPSMISSTLGNVVVLGKSFSKWTSKSAFVPKYISPFLVNHGGNWLLSFPKTFSVISLPAWAVSNICKYWDRPCFKIASRSFA